MTEPNRDPIDLYIAGAGAFGREVLIYAQQIAAAGWPELHPAGFLDDTGADPSTFGCDLPVISTITEWRPRGPGDRVVIAVGDPSGRQSIAERLTAAGARFVSLIHPTAWVAPNARLGVGCIVAPLAAVGPYVEIGDHCVLNVHAVIGHDSRLGRYTVLSPHAVVNGFVVIEDTVLLGSGALITPRRRIGATAKISAGAVVHDDVPAHTIAHGNPARALRRPG